ncbi:protein kinase [uncultured Piscinibacter sp.]|uniref:protein kinase domain-containing protein n=1 Tax=uncultured Piscinibacter sp. TaxID=1131835 RepID=UPI002634AC11|nr:protein kinase [uncultured Piscinibacter sp.]
MSARPFDLARRADSAAPLPQRLGKYLVSRVLGEGAMGVVYQALDPDIHRPVAIKAIRAPLLSPDAQDISATARFRTEAQAAGRLSHPNIVSVYEYGQADDAHYIAMEYVDGISLQALLSRGDRLPLDDALSVMQQLLEALACAHAQGVWHRDIKPANLLLTPEGRLKVTDFGIARIDSGELTHHTTVLGSPGYMAPERYTDEMPDRRVDIFSSGVLFYELLTGRTPFCGGAGAVMYQVLNTEPPPPSTLALDPPVPPHFDALVAQAIAKRAADRFDDAAQMRVALCKAAERPIAPAVSAQTMRRLRFGRLDAPTQVLPRAMAVMPRGSTPQRAPGGTAPQSLADIEQLLLPHLGPVARLVVRDAARRHADPAAMLAWLAAEVLEPEEREPFLAKARRLVPCAPPVGAPAPSGALPVLGTTPMRPELVEKAQQVLARQIGPIAALLARRAAATASTREAFFAALADAARPEVDRKALLAQLWKLR